jgi:hypothetical protein
MNTGWLRIVRLSEARDATQSFLVHLVRFGTRRPHICISEYDLANCLSDIGLLKTEVKRLVDTAKLSGKAKSEEIPFTKRQVHKYWAPPSPKYGVSSAKPQPGAAR